MKILRHLDALEAAARNLAPESVGARHVALPALPGGVVRTPEAIARWKRFGEEVEKLPRARRDAVRATVAIEIEGLALFCLDAVRALDRSDRIVLDTLFSGAMRAAWAVHARQEKPTRRSSSISKKESKR